MILRLLILLWLAGSVSAQDLPCTDSEGCLRFLAERQASTQTVVARLKQTKHLSLLNEPLVSYGRFAFRQPDEILWRIDDPPLTVRLGAGGIRFPGRPDIEKEVAQAPIHHVLGTLSRILAGNLTTAGGAFAIDAQANAEVIVVRMVPQQESWRRMFRQIELSFAAPHYVVRSIRLEEALGDRLEIELSDVHRNDAVSAAAWEEEKETAPALR